LILVIEVSKSKTSN